MDNWWKLQIWSSKFYLKTSEPCKTRYQLRIVRDSPRRFFHKPNLTVGKQGTSNCKKNIIIPNKKTGKDFLATKLRKLIIRPIRHPTKIWVKGDFVSSIFLMKNSEMQRAPDVHEHTNCQNKGRMEAEQFPQKCGEPHALHHFGWSYQNLSNLEPGFPDFPNLENLEWDCDEPWKPRINYHKIRFSQLGISAYLPYS